MDRFTARSGKFASVFSLMGISTAAFAGPGAVGSINYASGLAAQSVPVLGGVGLVVLSALLGLVSVKFLKNRQNGGQFLVLALVVGAMASGGSGIKLINDAYAGPSSRIDLSNDIGGTVSIPSPGFHQVLNTSGELQKITQINIVPGCELITGPLRPTANGGGNGGIEFRGYCSDSPSTELAAGEYCEALVLCGCLNGGINGGANGGNGGCVNGGQEG